MPPSSSAKAQDMIVSSRRRGSKASSTSVIIRAMSGTPRGPGRAHRGVAEEAAGAPGKGRQALDRGEPEARHVGSHRGVGIGRVAVLGAGLAQDPVAPTQDRAGPNADEGVAPALALLARLEQEAGRPLGLSRAQLEEGRDGRLAVVDETGPNRGHVALGGGAPRLPAARLYPPLG